MLEIGSLLTSKYSWVPRQMEQLFASSKFERLAFAITDKAMTEYAELTHPKRTKRLGNGEAAVMSYVRFHGESVGLLSQDGRSPSITRKDRGSGCILPEVQ